MARDPDAVDELIEQWREQRPELELDAMATFGRLGRWSALASRSIESVFETHGISLGEFDVLAALRRAGEPYELTPSELARALMLSSAGTTGRLDRLEASGHVERRNHPDDRRSWIVSLTPSGLALVDRSVEDHVANESRLLDPLTRAERKALDGTLRKLLAQFD